MEWRLRHAGPADAAALSLVAGASFLETFADILPGDDIVAHCTAKSSPAAFAAWADDPASIPILAEHAETRAPLGYAVLTTPDLPVPARPGDIELRRIYALAATHGTGIGAALMQGAVEAAREMEARRILLGVYGGNRRAHRFYEKQGFAVVGTRRFQVGANWHDDLIYARDL